MAELKQVIIVRKRRKGGHAHHGGAWKVAYADFVTAMMAFFLVMWLIGAGTKQQRAAISEYFKNPSMTSGQSTMAPSGMTGPGGASTSMIKLGGAMNLPTGPGDKTSFAPPSAEQAEKMAREKEKKRLEKLMKDLNDAIAKSQAMAPFKDQLLLDITSEGLRIQIVDKQNRPMFDLGSGALKPYTVQILHELAGFINQVPNQISISGHTDSAPYVRADSQYGNWELSADRANAARRTLTDGGMQGEKVARVVGLAASVPFDKADPSAATNRRISIVVMTDQAAKAALSPELVNEAKPLPIVPTLRSAEADHAAGGVPAAPAVHASDVSTTRGASVAPSGI
ncbi:chemotaxis protein MotB [Luteibacter sp. Sphag1AF]|uniref:flagellar motor protein MotB n=1 Tax=Luteibacter sp. Sphag1AF TaxID=2587031 RepID=UPI00160FF7F2|nr:flagellar motor protein MotB [Luteibacter sp. Sphag1AF]MBB3225709.1 chemotaxis protein MotB [Luteibacter sp. Sphag1AF]